MWRYPYRIETMGRQFPLYEEASLVHYNPDVLVRVSDDFYQRSPVNYSNYRQYDYASAYKRYPEYYYNDIREHQRFFPYPYLPHYSPRDSLEDYQPSRKRLKIGNGYNVSPNEVSKITNKERIYNRENLNNEALTHDLHQSEQSLDPVKLSEQLQKYFGKPSAISQSAESSSSTHPNLNRSVTENHNNGLFVDQMKQVYDSLIAKEDTNLSGELWYINERDRSFRSKGGGGTCRNCMKIGHSVKTCKNPKKIPLCFICGSDTHEGDACHEIRCSRHFKIGHYPEKCSSRDRDWAICNLCKIPGHDNEVCPDIWRRYHLTTSAGSTLTKSDQRPNPLKFCYNCSEEGHFGHECQGDRIDSYSYPSNPFIINYSILHKTSNLDKKGLDQSLKKEPEETEESMEKRFNIFKKLWSKE